MDMDNQDPENNRGGLVISDEVLAAIAVTTARETGGVSALLPHGAKLLRRLMGIRPVAAIIPQGEALRYVKITGTQAGLVLEMALRVHMGAKVPAVAAEVQRSVKNAVQSMTGKAVAKVNLRVQGVDF